MIFWIPSNVITSVIPKLKISFWNIVIFCFCLCTFWIKITFLTFKPCFIFMYFSPMFKNILGSVILFVYQFTPRYTKRASCKSDTKSTRNYIILKRTLFLNVGDCARSTRFHRFKVADWPHTAHSMLWAVSSESPHPFLPGRWNFRFYEQFGVKFQPFA